MPDESQYDVFLSHSAKDKAVVRPRPKAEGRRQKEEVIHSAFFLHTSLRAFGSDWAQLEAGTCGRGNLPFRDPLNRKRRSLPLRLYECAVNDLPRTSHADQLVKTCRAVFNHGDDFWKKITGNPNVDRPRCSLSASTGERVRVRCRFEIRPSRIREFRNRPHPKVVVTVDMLSTGVDIPALEFIVFLRPVKSRILWEQMLGRGTRLCPDINKSKFVVFDCFDGKQLAA